MCSYDAVDAQTRCGRRSVSLSTIDSLRAEPINDLCDGLEAALPSDAPTLPSLRLQVDGGIDSNNKKVLNGVL